MTIALATMVDGLHLEPLLTDVDGLRSQTVRHVLRGMAQYAQDDGSYRYGRSQSRWATLLELGVSTVKRVQALLIDKGVIERVTIGGGRRATLWKINVARIQELLKPSTLGQQPARPGPAQRHTQGFFMKMYMRAFGNLKHRPAGGVPTLTPAAQAHGQCPHGAPDELLSNGRHRCPGCRRSQN